MNIFINKLINRLQHDLRKYVESQDMQFRYIGDRQILAKTSWGGYVVVPSYNIDVAFGVLRDGIIEPWTTRCVRELLRPGDTYLNAGGNFGYYVALAGKLVEDRGLVIAVEPNPWIFSCLMKTPFYNGTPNNTKLYLAALYHAHEDKVSLRFDPQFLGGGAIEASHSPSSPSGDLLTQCIWGNESLTNFASPTHLALDRGIPARGLMIDYMSSTTTVDKISQECGRPIDFLHLDIEGSEPFALKGAESTLRSAAENFRMITEWSSQHLINRPQHAQFFSEVSEILFDRGWIVRRILPKIEQDGGILVSPRVPLQTLLTDAEHGDYVWLHKNYDRWSTV